MRSVSSRTGAAYSRDTELVTHRQPSRAGWWRLLLAALAAAVVTLLGAGTASAVTVPVPETRVGASTPTVARVVGPHECITAGQRWGNAPPQADSVVATGVAAKTVAGPNGALRDVATGRFLANPATASRVTSGAVHGNSRASTALTHLYRLEDLDGNLLKWGITDNLKGRYSSSFLEDKVLVPMTSGSRDQMLNLERWIVERDAGPLNLEPWAGSVG